MIRIGILGAARIAPRGIVTPANALLGAEVVAIAARSPERAQDFAAQHSIPMAGSYAELPTATTSTWCMSPCHRRPT
jgi:predicted dehydrogenase